MQTHDFLNQVKAALTKEGIVGKRSAVLIEEWKDHLENEISFKMATGLSKREAHQEAYRSLGTPVELAKLSAANLISSRWQGRHPWISAFGTCLCLAFLSVSLCAAFGGLVIDHWQYLESQKILSMVVGVLKALPWGFGLSWLVWHAWQLPAGWLGFWIVSGLVGLLLPLIQFSVSPADQGPNSGTIQFGLAFNQFWNVLWFASTAGLACSLWWFRGGCLKIRQLTYLFLMLAVINTLGCSISGKRKAMLSAVDAIENGRVDGISKDTDFIYSIPGAHKGLYSDVDRHHFVFENPNGSSGKATFFFGKSRESHEWEVFLIQVLSQETNLEWESIVLD
jgi:hypothetical protein